MTERQTYAFPNGKTVIVDSYTTATVEPYEHGGFQVRMTGNMDESIPVEGNQADAEQIAQEINGIAQSLKSRDLPNRAAPDRATPDRGIPNRRSNK